MSPETRPKSSGTFEKRGPRRERYPKTHAKMQERGTRIICFSNNIAEFTNIFFTFITGIHHNHCKVKHFESGT